jgi:hypothetical protein
MSLQTIEVAAVTLTLTELIEQINAAHEQCRQAYQSSLAHARRCGELLIEAKSQVQHGEWLTWLNVNCTVAARTAQAYMQVARDWSKLEESATVADLSLKDALKLLGDSEDADGETEPPKSDTPDAFTPPIAADLTVGDRALVVNSGNPYHDETVIVTERRSGLYLAQTEDGTSYLFMPTELQQIRTLEPQQPPTQPQPPQPRIPKVVHLKALLQKAYDEANEHFSIDLAREIEAELGL